MDDGVEEFRETEGAVLIDVRSKSEYQSGHVPGSINIEESSILKASSLIPDTQTPLFVYCLSGARSGRSARMLEHMGFSAVKNIGGINSYTGPVKKGN